MILGHYHYHNDDDDDDDDDDDIIIIIITTIFIITTNIIKKVLKLTLTLFLGIKWAENTCRIKHSSKSRSNVHQTLVIKIA